MACVRCFPLYYNATYCSKAMKAALKPAATGTVTTHAEIMFLNNFQSTPSFDELAHPTNTTEPTLQCVVEIGNPIFEATRTVNAAPISMVKPLRIRKY